MKQDTKIGRLATLGGLRDYRVADGSPDIRRWEVFAADSRRIGVVRELIVDTGHVVAFTEGLAYKIDKVGGGWINTWLSGEGFVMRFSGKGRIILQSHNPTRFGQQLGPLLPERES
jgi:hypothetical protein